MAATASSLPVSFGSSLAPWNGSLSLKLWSSPALLMGKVSISRHGTGPGCLARLLPYSRFFRWWNRTFLQFCKYTPFLSCLVPLIFLNAPCASVHLHTHTPFLSPSLPHRPDPLSWLKPPQHIGSILGLSSALSPPPLPSPFAHFYQSIFLAVLVGETVHEFFELYLCIITNKCEWIKMIE